jgi:enoyl-CoA hydratase/carnithine racemase
MERTRVLYQKNDHVAHVTLNRPEVLNAMDLRTHEELAEIWDDVERDDDVRAVLVTGAGEKAFSVGQDLKERARLNGECAAPTTFGSRGLPGFPRLTERFGLCKPLVAQVRGWALGGGFELALACDLIIASDDAVFGLPEVRLGLVPGAGGVFRLARQLPLKPAMGHLLTGRRMSAELAARYGLVNEVVPARDLDDCVAGWLDDLVRSAPLAVRAIKEAAMGSVDMRLEQAFTTRFPQEERRMHSQDAIEGPRAFAEKRAPVWRGM